MFLESCGETGDYKQNPSLLCTLPVNYSSWLPLCLNFCSLTSLPQEERPCQFDRTWREIIISSLWGSPPHSLVSDHLLHSHLWELLKMQIPTFPPHLLNWDFYEHYPEIYTVIQLPR